MGSLCKKWCGGKSQKVSQTGISPEGVGRGGGEVGHQYCLKFVTTQIDDKDDYEGDEYLWLMMAMIVTMTMMAIMIFAMSAGR